MEEGYIQRRKVLHRLGRWTAYVSNCGDRETEELAMIASITELSDEEMESLKRVVSLNYILNKTFP